MLIADSITNANYMSSRGIIHSIAKTTSRSPAEVFIGLAHRAARRTSQRLGVHVEFTNNALEVGEEYFPAQVVLDKFKEALTRLAMREAGID